MTDLFNLAVAYMSYPGIAGMYFGLPKEDTAQEVKDYGTFKAAYGLHYSLFLTENGQIYFNYKGESLHINQQPLYERYFEFLERGV